MKIAPLLLTAAFAAHSLLAQEIIKADDIEKQMGLAPAPSAEPPKTRSFGKKMLAPALAVRRVIQRAAAASSATLQTLKKRGVTVEPIRGGGSERISVPVVENAQASFRNILFEKDSTRLADDASAAQVAEIAQVMRKYPERCFVVEGHTCDLGSAAHNEQLSVARSAAVESRLLAAGVRAEQIVALGFGESDPVANVPSDAPSDDPVAESGRRQNRRVVIRLAAP